MAPACDTVTGVPAIVRTPVRGVGLGLAATAIVTVALPLPEAGLTAIHDAPLEVVQPQPAAAVTLTVDALDPAPTGTVAGATDGAQPGVASVNGLETALRPVPSGPMADTLASYTPPGSGQPPTSPEKSNRMTPSAAGAGFPSVIQWKGAAAPAV